MLKESKREFFINLNHEIQPIMDIQTRKIEFVQEFLKLQNEELIARLEKLLHSNKSHKTKDVKPITLAELNARIDKSIVDSDNNRVTTSDNLIAEIEKWR